MQPTSAFVVANGVRYHAKRIGNGRPLLLIHGLIGSADTWHQNWTVLSEFRTVYALDLANMGETERVPGQAAGLEATAASVAALMGSLGIEAADVVGHSHGGAVTMMLAAMYPDRVRRTVLFAPANPFCKVSLKVVASYNSPLGTWCARQMPKLPEALKHYGHKRVYGDKSKATKEALAGYTRGLNAESLEHLLRIVRSWNADMALLLERMSLVAKTPALLVWGEVDPAVSVASGRRLAEVLGTRLIVFPGVGHIPFAEKPDECNASIREWLEEA